MRFVMIPVPTEHVRDVIDVVLRSSPDTDERGNLEMARVRRSVQLSDARTRALLRTVAEAAIAGTVLTVADVAAALDEEEVNVVGLVRDLDAMTVHRNQRLVVLSGPRSVRSRPTGDATLTMEPRRAGFVLDALQILDPPAP